jgi:hypothetical protein
MTPEITTYVVTKWVDLDNSRTQSQKHGWNGQDFY